MIRVYAIEQEQILTPGRYDFKMPYPAKVVNLKSGVVEPTVGDILPLELVAGETCWFELLTR